MSDDRSDIIEGFICPVCKSDERDFDNLIEHFQKSHSDDKDLLSSFKDVFRSAKKKILNFDESELSKTFDNTLKSSISLISGNQNQYQDGFDFIDEPQELGLCVDYFQYFKGIRNPRIERYATETNKLIIRLNKLLSDRPSEPVSIKLHEQNLVPWIDGKLVKLCPSCAKTFFLARRQHHCRLCGSIMCNDCSCFLSIDDSISLINPERTENNSKDNEIAGKEPVDQIRLCEHCLHLLETRKEMQDSRSVKPMITKLYDRIESIKKEVMPDLVMYEKIVNTLYLGDSVYTINDATLLRGKVGKMAEILDSLSKDMLQIKCQKGSREESLQKSIRLGCIKFIKENMLSIHPIPLEEEIRKIQEERISKLSHTIERDRRMAQEAFERYDLGGTSSNASNYSMKSKSGSAMKTVENSSWVGHQENQKMSDLKGDPLVEQINIIKSYIKQARDAMRFEEIETLEENLRELQHEFYIQQQF
ncbi:unnamed protein product [Diamesa serratosioi]